MSRILLTRAKDGSTTYLKEVTDTGELTTTDKEDEAYQSGSDYYVRAMRDFVNCHFKEEVTAEVEW